VRLPPAFSERQSILDDRGPAASVGGKAGGRAACAETANGDRQYRPIADCALVLAGQGVEPEIEGATSKVLAGAAEESVLSDRSSTALLTVSGTVSEAVGIEPPAFEF
jgi:hypothetical protein